MGFDLVQVLSDDKHYSAFVCGVCENLVSIDGESSSSSNSNGNNNAALVTEECSHVACHVCLDSHWKKMEQENAADASSGPCPTCRRVIQRGRVRMLREAQPLAYRLLELVQVACLEDKGCNWSGDYGKIQKHSRVTHGNSANSVDSSAAASGSNKDSKRRHLHKSSSMSRVTKSRRKKDSPSSPIPTDVSESPDLQDNDKPPVTPTTSPRWAETTPEGDREIQLDGHGGSLVVGMDSHTPLTIGTNDQQNFTPTSPRWQTSTATPATAGTSSSNHGTSNNIGKNNESIGTVPSPSKSSRRGDAAPNLVQRTKSEDKTDFTKALANSSNNTSSNNNEARGGGSKMDDSALHISYNGENLAVDGASSNNSNGMLVMETVNEERGIEDLLSPARRKKLLDKAEKLKKQANAKFNKGDLAHSRELYSEGIAIMKTMSLEHKHEELVAHMYSNRAVTYFREKRFDSCVADCDKAIELLPSYEKSWIRKWRALMALGDFDQAYQCLELGMTTIPDSRRIQTELDKCVEEKKLLDQAQDNLDIGDYNMARELLKPHARASDNIKLLFLAAQADVGLGHVEAALEKINKALRFNPTHPQGLELRGHTLYLSGDTAKGVHILQETLNRDKENAKLQAQVTHCQTTHLALTKGRASVKRGKYNEATEFFSAAISASGLVPTRCPLFEMLRTERAEAWLLSRKYLEALKDCQEVILIQRENSTAWTVRAEVLVALGKPEEAQRELSKIRRTWGADNAAIDEAYRRVDYELRISKADEQLEAFCRELEKGNTSVLTLTVNVENGTHYPLSQDSGSNDDGKAQRRSSTGKPRRSSLGTSSSSVNRRKSTGGGNGSDARRTPSKQR